MEHQEAITSVMERYNVDETHPTIKALREGLQGIDSGRKEGTLKKWIQERNGKNVELFQWYMTGLWSPGVREVSARSTFFLMDDSRGNYAQRVISVGDDRILTEYDFGDRHTFCLYIER